MGFLSANNNEMICHLNNKTFSSFSFWRPTGEADKFVTPSTFVITSLCQSPLCHQVYKIVRNILEALGDISRSEAENTSRFARVLRENNFF